MAFVLFSRIAACLGFGGRKKRVEDSLTQCLNAEAAPSGLEGALRDASPVRGLVCRRPASRAPTGAAEPDEPAAALEPPRAPTTAVQQQPATPSSGGTPWRRLPTPGRAIAREQPPTTPSSGLTTPARGPIAGEAVAPATEHAQQGEALEFPSATKPLQSHNSSDFSFHCTAMATPAPAAPACSTSEATPLVTPAGVLKFLFESSSSPHISGMANTVHKFAADQPVRIHHTPYEQRIERTLDAEQRAIDLFKQRAQPRS